MHCDFISMATLTQGQGLTFSSQKSLKQKLLSTLKRCLPTGNIDNDVLLDDVAGLVDRRVIDAEHMDEVRVNSSFIVERTDGHQLQRRRDGEELRLGSSAGGHRAGVVLDAAVVALTLVWVDDGQLANLGVGLVFGDVVVIDGDVCWRLVDV